jgi:hypothetical protein
MCGSWERRGTHDPLEAHEFDVTLGVARLIAMAEAFRVTRSNVELSDEVRTAKPIRRAILLAFADCSRPIAPRAELGLGEIGAITKQLLGMPRYSV